MKIYRKIKEELLWYFCPHHRDVLNKKWRSFQYIFSHKSDFNESFLESHKDVVEIEHQVGRFLNMRKIALEIHDNKYEGDVVEFGTFQGLGLIYLSQLIGGNRIFVGVDSFEGLPVSSTIWKKGQFSDTNIDIARENLHKYHGGGAILNFI
jgi:hypothetical protein